MNREKKFCFNDTHYLLILGVVSRFVKTIGLSNIFFAYKTFDIKMIYEYVSMCACTVGLKNVNKKKCAKNNISSNNSDNHYNKY